jgi:hypothetical protein
MSNSQSRKERFNRRIGGVPLAWLFCFFTTIAAAPIHAADTAVEVIGASLKLDDDVYELYADLDLDLARGASRAIEAGLPLHLTYQIAIEKSRRYRPDADIATLEQGYELSYHALSQRYLVKSLSTGEQRGYGNLAAAIDALTSVRGLPVIDAALFGSRSRYNVRVRAVVTLRAAPDTLSWLLFWTDDWSATSDWYEWKHRR